MRYALLGPVEVRDGTGRPVEVGGTRLRALLTRLALDPGRTVTPDALVDGLWGGAPPGGAGNALQSLVSRLRRALGGTAVIESDPAGYRLVATGDDVDALRFERLVAEGRRALAAGNPEQAHERLTGALGLWRGPALADLADVPFAHAAVTRLDDLRLSAREDRAEAALALGRHTEELSGLESLTRDHPLRERLTTLLITALHACGRQADALAAYERTRHALAEELGLDPGPELAAAHLAVLRRSGPGGDRPRGNLRAQLTTFVGRDAEVGAIGGLLAANRLVTLVGAGGAGKTRLAVESAAPLGEAMPDGVWLVELAGLTDPGEIASAVLGVFAREAPLLGGVPVGLGPRPRDLAERLTDQLRERRMLLILDNCEHLIAGAADLADLLLAACPGLRILATSREPLGITGETLHPVGPLPLPRAGATAQEALRSASVRLFTDRARAVRAGFEADADSIADVIEICRRLDGLPLAIELAAARLRALTAGQLAARLDDRFRLLTGGSRVALERHRTLRAVVEWSWGLLTPAEVVLARRLAAFAGGADLAAIEAVCGPLEDDTLDLLAALVDKSLVEVRADGEVRYRMLETIRAYAAERLAESGEADQVRALHAAHFLDLAERAEPLLRGVDQLTWMGALTTEHDNLTAALRHVIDGGESDPAVRMIAAMGWFWSMRGEIGGVLPLVREALAVPGGTPIEARKVTAAIAVMYDFGDWGFGPRRDPEELRHAIREATPADPHSGHPILALVEPVAAMLIDDNDAALAAITRRMDHPEPWVRAICLVLRAHFKLNDGEVEAAEADLAGSLALFRQVGDRWGKSAAVGSLAEVREMRGDRSGAVSALEESLALVRELGAAEEVLETRTRLAVLRARAGDTGAATAELVELRAAILPGPRQLVVFAEMALGETALLAGDTAGAEQWYDQAAARMAGVATGPPQIRLMLLCGRSLARTRAGDPACARKWILDSLGDAQAVQDKPVLAALVESLACTWADDDVERAAVLLGYAGAVRGLDDLGNPIIAQAREQIRAALGPPAYAAAVARGAALTPTTAPPYLTP